MRVLFTNNGFALRAGSELYVRDVAIELMQRGHCPVAYSTRLGSVADELRAATVPVIRSLESLGEPPDIIHGHHHYETLTEFSDSNDLPKLREACAQCGIELHAIGKASGATEPDPGRL